MITIYKTATMRDASLQICQLLGKIDKSNLSTMHTVIVPDRASLEMERLLLQTVGGSFNVQVLTFRRLASKLLPKFEYLSKQAGIMALAGIIQDNRQNLTCYTKGVDTAGFVSDMYDTICMMKYCKISPQKLTDDQLPRSVKGKAKDIALLYEAYLDYTRDRFIDSADKLDLLCDCLFDVDFVRQGYFYLCDFDNFSAQELAIIEKLMLVSRGVVVSCCASAVQRDKYLYLNDIFEGVCQICQRNAIEPNVIDVAPCDTTAQTKHIRQNLYRYGAPPTAENNNFVEIFQGETRNDEVYALACQIQKYVRSGGRFKDVYVVASDVNSYTNSITTIFEELQIPYFCDRQFCLGDQAYARFVLDYLTLYRNNGRLQNVLNFVKNYLFCGDFDGNTDTNDIFKFENYCLKYNVSYNYDHFNLGKNEPIFSSADGFRQKFNNLYKSVVVPPVATANDYVQTIRNLMDAVCLDERNNLFAQSQLQLGYVTESNVTSQTAEKFQQVLTQAEKIMGGRLFKLDDFIKMFSAAVNSVKISVIPQINDCVVFANMAKARKHDIKFLALLGANQGAMPIVKKDCKLLTDGNIKDLVCAGINVEPQIFVENKRERFSLFQLLLEPTQKLYVSFASTDGADGLSPSNFVGELTSLFVCKGKNICICDQVDEEIYTQKQAIAKVILNKRRLADKQIVKMPSFTILQQRFASQTQKYDFVKQGKQISIDSGEKLYFKSARTSVSQLTDFFKCPYKFYVEYGLNVKPREVAQLKSADLGNILHEVMEYYVANMDKAESDDVTTQKANEFFHQALNNDFYKGLKNDAQMQGTLEQLKLEAVRMCIVVKNQLANSKFQNIKTELSFGDGDVPPVKVNYGSGEFSLVGKIDRIDGYNGHMFVLDYKSGAVASQYGEKDLYIGQKMQLLVYLRAAQDAYALKPSGFYYFNMHNNFTDAKTEKVYTYNGRTLDDLDIACAMDTTLVSGSSEKLGLKLTAKGALNHQGNKLVSASQIDAQVDYATELIKRAGKLMQQGYAAVSPYDGCCDYCDYKCICDFGDLYNYPERKVSQKVTAGVIESIIKNKDNK